MIAYGMRDLQQILTEEQWESFINISNKTPGRLKSVS